MRALLLINERERERGKWASKLVTSSVSLTGTTEIKRDGTVLKEVTDLSSFLYQIFTCSFRGDSWVLEDNDGFWQRRGEKRNLCFG